MTIEDKNSYPAKGDWQRLLKDRDAPLAQLEVYYKASYDSAWQRPEQATEIARIWAKVELATPYLPNTRHWQPGDIVIHTADAKSEQMLMRVISYNERTGLCRTRYNEAGGKLPRGVYENDLRYLLDPEAFAQGKAWKVRF